ncbi:MAG: 2,3-bisphosphoglycerate-independent phosphoglycerate mutase [bacterium]
MAEKIKKKNTPLILVIMDGWGVAPASEGNAISLAKKPNFDHFIENYPVLTLQASGEAVGLPWRKMGSSEVGHMNIGGGKIVYQDLPRISHAIWDESFFKNEVFLKACAHVKNNNSTLHFIGLVSNGGVHSSVDHLYALLDLIKAQKIDKVYIHAILDGRDTAYNEAKNSIEKLQEKLNYLDLGQIASLSGRFWAMDRDNHWERVEEAYLAMACGKSDQYFEDPAQAIDISYQKNIFDEQFIPAVITKNNQPVGIVKENDAIIFFNFRADRGRELTKAFVLPSFEKFSRPFYLKNLFFVTMTEYEDNLPVEVAFKPEVVKEPLAKTLSDRGYKQLHIAETEKYAHITYFFNGGVEEPFAGEDNAIIPSPRVSSYDKTPAMSAYEMTNRIIEELTKDKYDFIVVNFANPDMVGHTGNLEATVKAVEVVDECLGKIVNLVLSKNGVVVITADHGNAEEVINMRTGEIDKEHSTVPVPFLLIGKEWEGKTIAGVEAVGKDLSLLKPAGLLSDIAPTILKLLGIPKSKEMTGMSLI